MAQPQHLRVHYSPFQSVTANDSFSPSAGKPELLVQQLENTPSVSITANWLPLTPEELSLSHDPDFVSDILSCRKKNGFNNTSKLVADSLPYTNGSFYSAAVDALTRNTATMSPTSGFHHAGYRTAHGFCTFNGLTVAACLLKKNHLVESVGIIDLDAHWGDGTVDVIDQLGKLGLGSRLPAIEHMSFGNAVFYMTDGDFRTAPHTVINFDDWLSTLGDSIRRQFAKSDILFYQAGVDSHINDPLGQCLTTSQMSQRDDVVFSVAKEMGKPVVWNLAGGYQTPIQVVLDLHHTTVRSCLQNYLK